MHVNPYFQPTIILMTKGGTLTNIFGKDVPLSNRCSRDHLSDGSFKRNSPYLTVPFCFPQYPALRSKERFIILSVSLVFG